MRISKKIIIGSIAVLTASMVFFSVPLSASLQDPIKKQLISELSQWGSQYQEKSEQKKFFESNLQTTNEEMRQLSCKALSNRISLCQRGYDEFCAEEKSAREAMITSYGAPFETVCQKSFQQQATGS